MDIHIHVSIEIYNHLCHLLGGELATWISPEILDRNLPKKDRTSEPAPQKKNKKCSFSVAGKIKLNVVREE